MFSKIGRITVWSKYLYDYLISEGKKKLKYLNWRWGLVILKHYLII